MKANLKKIDPTESVRKKCLIGTVKSGRGSCRFAADSYAYESITPADVRCSPLLTSLPSPTTPPTPAKPGVPALLVVASRFNSAHKARNPPVC